MHFMLKISFSTFTVFCSDLFETHIFLSTHKILKCFVIGNHKVMIVNPKILQE